MSTGSSALDDAEIIDAIKVTPEMIHSDFVSRRMDSAADYLVMARDAYQQDYPDAVVMALELVESETAAAKARALVEYGERGASDG